MRFPPAVFLALCLTLPLVLAACDASPAVPEPEPGITNGQPQPDIHTYPRWSPDGRWILHFDAGVVRYDVAARNAYHDPNRRGLWAITPDGQTRRMLVRGAFSGDWAPDSRAITFEVGMQIYTARVSADLAVDSASVTRLTRSGANFTPAWSPDGAWIAFDTPDGLRIVRPDGTGQRRVSGGGDPSWHPDGRSIFSYKGANSTDTETIFVRHYPFDAMPTETLRVRPGVGSREPQVSPDGRRIVFRSNGSEGGIWVRSLGEGPVTLRRIRPDGQRQPDWSPDGRQIVYVGPKNTLWLMDADGRNARALTTRPE